MAHSLAREHPLPVMHTSSYMYVPPQVLLGLGIVEPPQALPRAGKLKAGPGGPADVACERRAAG